MSKTSVVLVTCAGRRESERIAKALVSHKLAACVSIVPGVTSVYRWEGKLQKAGEMLLIIKTQQRRFKKLCRVLKENHSYSCPEIISIPVTGGSRDYLAWVHKSLNS